MTGMTDSTHRPDRVGGADDGDALRAPIRVVLVDDDALVRAGLRLILGGNSGIEVVAEGGNGLQGVDAVAQHRPDVVLMDIRMPRLDGLAATERILAAHPDTRVIVLTTFDAGDLVLSALRIGAAGFLLKDTAPEQLVAGVQAVAAGQPMLSPSVTAQLIASVTQDPSAGRSHDAQSRLATLTEREREVAVAIGQGLSNAEIATSLFMSVATVKSHVGRLFAKLGAENRVQVAICVHDAGLT